MISDDRQGAFYHSGCSPGMTENGEGSVNIEVGTEALRNSGQDEGTRLGGGNRRGGGAPCGFCEAEC